jgi:tetratricopeptide (TPR) repeat protein
MGRPECVDAYQESFDIALRIEARSLAAVAAHNLGNAYLYLPALRNLDDAERWYRKSLELVADGDRMHRAGSIGQLGLVAFKRFQEACAAKRPEPELLRHLNDALRWYREALEMAPPDAVGQLALIHRQLGNIYIGAGDLALALHHWRESIRLEEVQGNLYGAAQTRFNVAHALARAGRLPDARQYADAALRDFQTYGANAADDVRKTLTLISIIAKTATP